MLRAAVITIALAGCVPPDSYTVMQFPTLTVRPKLSAKTVAQALARRGYPMRIIDEASGIIETDWRNYTIPFGLYGTPMPVRDSVRLLMLDDSMEITFVAQCDTGAGISNTDLRSETHVTTGWTECKRSAMQPNEEIRERYIALMDYLRRMGGNVNAAAE